MYVQSVSCFSLEVSWGWLLLLLYNYTFFLFLLHLNIYDLTQLLLSKNKGILVIFNDLKNQNIQNVFCCAHFALEFAIDCKIKCIIASQFIYCPFCKCQTVFKKTKPLAYF